MTGPVLGLNAVFHDSSAALLVDGRLAALVEEERLSRVRHAKRATIANTALLPYRAIDAALRAAGTAFAEVEAVGYSFDPEIRLRTTREAPQEADVPPGDYGSPDGERKFHDLIKRTGTLLQEHYGSGVPVLFFPHHLCHLLAAYHACPWDDTALLAVDGIGEADTCTWAAARAGGLRVLGQSRYPHSLGLLWEKVTEWLGLQANQDEGTVMALAAYGDAARFRGALRRVLAPLPDGTFRVDPALARFRCGDVAGLEGLLGPRRLPGEPLEPAGARADAAAALQELTEEALLGLARRLREESGLDRLVLTGGVALNCLANAALARSGLFSEVWALPPAGDSGTAFGAACAAERALRGRAPPREEWTHAYHGPADLNGAVGEALAAAGLKAAPLEPAELISRAAQLLNRGKVLGWYEGRAEVGPRALGHRSLLADPRSASMRERLNRLKGRLPFRPLGPMLRREDAAEFLDLPEAAAGPCRFMMAAVPVRQGRRERIPAVLHKDGTTRPQLVDQAGQPRLTALLGAFAALSGVPVLVNTSFNVGEPIVGSPRDALATYLGHGIDALVLEDRLLEKGA